jgi:hypothetical protein
MPLTLPNISTLEDAFALLERDFPANSGQYGWAVGLCPCDHEDGPFKCMIDRFGQRSGGVTVIDLVSGEVYQIARDSGGGWHIEVHAPTALAAIQKAIGLALEQEH